MAKSRTRAPAGPTLTPSQGVALLTASLENARKIALPRVSQAMFDAWAANALHNLRCAFGEDSSQANEFDGILRGTNPIGIMVSGYCDNIDYDRLRGEAVGRAIPPS